MQKPAPPRLIEGGLPTEAVVADVVVSRLADHQPLYRQAQMMARQGVRIDRATLAFWVGYAAAEIAPVVRRLKQIVLGSAHLFADETAVPVLDPGRGRTKQGYFWAVACDDRPRGGPVCLSRKNSLFAGSNDARPGLLPTGPLPLLPEHDLSGSRQM